MSISRTPRLLYKHAPGLTSYMDAESVQQGWVRKLLDAKAHGERIEEMAILSFEMKPVYTCGRRQAGLFTQSEIEKFRLRGAGFVETQRGGHLTFHGPGQVVLYPILDLRTLRKTVREYVCALEKSVIDVLGMYNIKGVQTENNGVWLDNQRKIASVGVHVRRSVTSHGVGLNVSTDPKWFREVVACNLPDAKLVSMRDCCVDADIAQVSKQFAVSLATRLGLDVDVP